MLFRSSARALRSSAEERHRGAEKRADAGQEEVLQDRQNAYPVDIAAQARRVLRSRTEGDVASLDWTQTNHDAEVTPEEQGSALRC